MLYAKYRPTYPQSVYDTIIDFCRLSSRNTFNTALDVGCGTGQSTFPLTTNFDHVIGLDASKSQINEAREAYAGLDFRVGPGEDLAFMEDESVDLVTTAQSLHYLDRTKFFEEAARYEIMKMKCTIDILLSM